MDFKKFKKAIQDKVATFNHKSLFQTNLDRGLKNLLWEKYLNAFEEADEKQHHNCNYCRGFIKRWASIVHINDNYELESMFDVINDEYQEVADGLSQLIKSLPIQSVFGREYTTFGMNTNLSEKGITWNHFYIALEHNKASLSPEKVSEKNGIVTSFKNALENFKTDAIQQVLELIPTLYKGVEYKNTVEQFQLMKNEYDALPSEKKKLFIWKKASIIHESISKIRGSSIGTLIEDLSNGMELNSAVRAYESKVNPLNYRRTTAAPTLNKVNLTKEKLTEMGYIHSLQRRVANESDLNANNVLFVDHTNPVNSSIFDEIVLKSDKLPNLDKVEEISINDFIEKIIPTATTIEAYVSNDLQGNFVTMTNGIDPEAPTMFKWNNDFGWAYSKGLSDSIKERVKRAGGSVTGVMRISLGWSNSDDMDLHLYTPDGSHIYYSNKVDANGTNLDVDMNAGSFYNDIDPVENIAFPKIPRIGTYKIAIHRFCARNNNKQGYTVEMEYGGKTYYYTSVSNSNFDLPFQIKNGELILDKNWTEGKADKRSIKKWNIQTESFVPVKSIMLSPNYWETNVGNKHFFFMLDKCISDEVTLPFFNEFLKQELVEHRHTMEQLANKLAISKEPYQLSGLGFSETLRNELVVKVTGKFTRTLKIKF
jgi:hypothetical protein